MSDNIFQPIDLSPELQRESEKKDMLLMRKLDNKLGVSLYQITDIIAEMNVRFTQYKGQFGNTSIDFRILQTVQDYNRFITPLQIIRKGKKIVVNDKLPIASLKDGTLIYANPDNIFMIFSKEKTKE